MAGNIWTEYERLKKERIKEDNYNEVIDGIIEEINKLEEKEETEFEDCFVCQNCREMYPLEEMGTSELAMQDQICVYCMEDGYGR